MDILPELPVQILPLQLQFIWDLKDLDCRDTVSLRAIRDTYLSPAAFPLEFFLLQRDGQYETTSFVLKVGGPQQQRPLIDRNELVPYGAAPVNDRTFEDIWHLLSRVRADVNRPYLPEYSLCLGEVYVYSEDRGGNRTDWMTRSDYYVLMDLTSPRKTLWLAFSSIPEREGAPWRECACLLENVGDWPEGFRFPMTPGVVDASRGLWNGHMPRFSTCEVDEVLIAIFRGWA